jgi:glutaredoxin 3
VTAKVVVYSTRFCGYCVMAARLLRKKGVEFQEIDVSADPETRVWLRAATGRLTVPQIFIDDRPVGGFDDLAALDRHGKLDQLLFPAGAGSAPSD